MVVATAAASAGVSTSTTSTTTAATTTLSSTTTTLPATTTTVPDLLAGVNWIQATYASPCGDSTVELVGGSSTQAGQRTVLDDVVGIDSAAGLALAFLSCRGPGGTTTQTTATLVRAEGGDLETLTERELGPAARVVAVNAPKFTVEGPAGPTPAGACCAEVFNRQTLVASPRGIVVVNDEQIAAFEQTVNAAPAVGEDAELVRRSVPRAALCYRWDNVWLGAADEPAEPAPLTEPSAELQTIRLALIHLTGRWIDPTDHMNGEMAAVASAYQEGRGLAVDGAIGDETTSALAADLGCPDNGEFTMVPPSSPGPRNFRSVAELIAATERFATSGTSGSPSIDQLLTDARWDGRNSMFLGCYRWQAPATGMSCSWSGATPLQLVGLVTDPATPGLGPFFILYARSGAV